jgi:uncharacterized protein with PQ loop repeat
MLEWLNDLALVTKVHAQIHYPWAPSAAIALFTAANTVRVLAYVPQILKAARDRNGASAISYTTWGLFFISHLTTILYAVVYQGDAIMALIFLGNAIACLAIVAITFLKRRRYRKLAGQQEHSMTNVVEMERVKRSA